MCAGVLFLTHTHTHTHTHLLPLVQVPLRIGVFSLLGADAAFASRGNRGTDASFVGYNDTTDARQVHVYCMLCALHSTSLLYAMV